MAKTTASKRRAPGEGSLFQRGSDSMWVGVYDIPTEDGSRRQKRVYAKDYEQARNKLDELIDDVKNGVVISKVTTVENWLIYWLSDIKGPHIRPKTKKFYEEAIRLHICPAIGKKRLDKLTPQDVRGMLKTVVTSRNRQRALTTLNLALKAAVSDGNIRRNPCVAVQKPEHLAAERSAFTVADAKKIIQTALTHEVRRDTGAPALGTMWAGSFLSGARPGEVLGLEWDRLDLDNGVGDFSWQLQQLQKTHGCPPGEPCGKQRPSYCPQSKWVFEAGFEYRECYKSLVWTRPKTEAGKRAVPLVPAFVKLLREHAERVEPNPHNLVWHHTDGRPISPTDSFELWQELLVLAGVTTLGKTIPWYSARHSAATILQEVGVAEEVRMKIMGQSSVAAHRKYIHVDQSQARAALGMLGDLLM